MGQGPRRRRKVGHDMSGRIVGEVFDSAPEDLKPAELLTLLAIAEDARDRDRLARYSDVASLVIRTRMAPGTIRNALSELTRRGLIIAQRDRVHRGGAHQEYVVADLHDARRATIRAVNGHTNTSPHNDTNTPKRVTHQ